MATIRFSSQSAMLLQATLLLSLCVASTQGFQQPLSVSSCNPLSVRGRIRNTRKLLKPQQDCFARCKSIATTTLYASVGAEENDENEGILKAKRKIQFATKQLEEKEDQVQFLLAVLPSLLAFFAWEDISKALSNTLALFGDSSGIFADTLLRPTITGVVVPVIAIALATLVSTTINVLRDREVQLRTLINKESCDLRLLRCAVFGLFGTRQHASRRARACALLCRYVEQLERESNIGAVEALEELQLSGGIAANELAQLTQMLHGVDGAAASRQGSVGYADDLVRSLNDYRSQRVAELLSGFPAIHWGVLILLSFSVCGTFLLASNQPMNQYLNSVSLRALFALLVGVCSGTATICLNLADPFRGTFSILEASAQLRDLRLCLKEDVAEATAEAGEISSNLVHTILLGGAQDGSGINNGSNTENPRQSGHPETLVGGLPFQTNNETRRYALMPTLYFHLLTGPFGSNVKAMGDLIAWLASIVARRTKALSQRITALWKVFRWKKWRWQRRRRASI